MNHFKASHKYKHFLGPVRFCGLNACMHACMQTRKWKKGALKRPTQFPWIRISAYVHSLNHSFECVNIHALTFCLAWFGNTKKRTYSGFEHGWSGRHFGNYAWFKEVTKSHPEQLRYLLRPITIDFSKLLTGQVMPCDCNKHSEHGPGVSLLL